MKSLTEEMEAIVSRIDEMAAAEREFTMEINRRIEGNREFKREMNDQLCKIRNDILKLKRAVEMDTVEEENVESTFKRGDLVMVWKKQMNPELIGKDYIYVSEKKDYYLLVPNDDDMIQCYCKKDVFLMHQTALEEYGVWV